ncbi:MAG: hypothetical protein H7Y04_03100 [Verrucomicrobia bacterium]|nr:hypothetical protein [Cytophagales bacterium]
MKNDNLLKKLRLKTEEKLLILNAPPDFAEQLEEVVFFDGVSENAPKKFDFVMAFVHDTKDLNVIFHTTVKHQKYDAIFWLAYPKISFETDLNRNNGWQIVENAGFECVSQTILDEKWAALRFRPEGVVI